MDFSDDDLKELMAGTGGLFEIGEKISEHYEVLEFIAEGADSEVYRVRNLVDGEEYAAKVPKDGNEAKQYEHENNILKVLRKTTQSPHLLKAYPSVIHEGCPILIMELLEGKTLQVVLEASGIESAHRAKKIIKDILGGLSELHGAGVIHCDIKPSNIMMTRRGAVLFDYSASVLAEEVDSSTPRRGTEGYLPPNEPLSYARDIFSVGVIYFQLLVGNKPAWTRRVGATDPTDQSLAMPDNFGQYLGARPVLEKALNFNPHIRFQDAGEMLEHMHNPLHSRRILSGLKILTRRHRFVFLAPLFLLIALGGLTIQNYLHNRKTEANARAVSIAQNFSINPLAAQAELEGLPQTGKVKKLRKAFAAYSEGLNTDEGLTLKLSGLILSVDPGLAKETDEIVNDPGNTVFGATTGQDPWSFEPFAGITSDQSNPIPAGIIALVKSAEHYGLFADDGSPFDFSSLNPLISEDYYTAVIKFHSLAGGNSEELKIKLTWDPNEEQFVAKFNDHEEIHGITDLTQVDISLQHHRKGRNRDFEKKREPFHELQPRSDGVMVWESDGLRFEIQVAATF